MLNISEELRLRVTHLVMLGKTADVHELLDVSFDDVKDAIQTWHNLTWHYAEAMLTRKNETRILENSLARGREQIISSLIRKTLLR